MESITSKRLTLIKARSGMARGDFDAHWSGVHAEIAKDLPGLIWYVQNHVLRCLHDAPRGFADVQGVAEIAFDTADKLRTSIDAWPRVGELRDDEGLFLGDKASYVTQVPPDMPAVQQRRVIALLQAADAAPFSPKAESIAQAVQDIAATVPCHAEAVDPNPETPPFAGQPHPVCAVFAELPPETPAGMLAAEGPILGPIARLGMPVTGFLVAAEAKRLPTDLAV